ncbi:MAG TPA: metal-sulfur cluster assembly factor [Magnetospirillum sp.]|nr:metal-sulfur cluster assembly factor [Magnetospirillum sp.]
MIAEAQALEALKGVIDPDVGINIVDLGMIERVAVTPDGVHVAMIMTTPACPQSGYLRDESARLLEQAGAGAVTVEVLDSPLWAPERLSETAKQILGW